MHDSRSRRHVTPDAACLLAAQAQRCSGRRLLLRREEGFFGLWKGVTPNIGRNAIINAAELASYDAVQSFFLAPTC